MRSTFTRALAARPATTIARSSILSSTAARFSSTATQASPESTITRTPTSAPTQPATKTYLIERTTSNQLPVYTKTRAAGQSKFTLIKRVRGDKRAFVQDLVEALGVPREEVVLNPVTGHIQLKGFRDEEVKKWLAGVAPPPTQA